MHNRKLYCFHNLKIFFFGVMVVIFQGSVVKASSGRESGPLTNSVFRENIRTVQFFRKGWEFSNPVIDLGSDQQLLLKFDELSEGTTNFSYTITHCDVDWYPSRLVQAE